MLLDYSFSFSNNYIKYLTFVKCKLFVKRNNNLKKSEKCCTLKEKDEIRSYDKIPLPRERNRMQREREKSDDILETTLRQSVDFRSADIRSDQDRRFPIMEEGNLSDSETGAP